MLSAQEKKARKIFQRCIDEGNPVGEVTSIDRFILTIKGAHPTNIGAILRLENGSRALVREITDDHILALDMGTADVNVGMLAVVETTNFVAPVGKKYLGRVINIEGEPLDGKGPITPDAYREVFAEAPKIHERQQLDDLLVSGVTVVDSLFPIVKGQRLAILGDSKSGKSTLATQLVINQNTTDMVTIYVLVAKRPMDIDQLVRHLESNDALKNAIIVVSTVQESLVASYVAPYIGCAMAEYFWQDIDRDALVVYDDLTSHSQVYREISLLSGANPGRDSYPGDAFYIHSSLLERGGRLHRNHKTLTVLPLVLAMGGDITAYMPTNIISITDGQWILDMKLFLEGRRPAVNTGLSVTRVGGRGHNDRQKDLGAAALKALAAYEQAKEFSRFGADLSEESERDLAVGNYLIEIFNQLPGQSYPIEAQQMMLDLAMSSDVVNKLNVRRLKNEINTYVRDIVDEESYIAVRNKILRDYKLTNAEVPVEPTKQEVLETSG